LDSFCCKHTQFHAGLYRICLPEKAPDCAGLREKLPDPSPSSLFARGEITITEIEGSTGANRNTIKVHLKKIGAAALPGGVGKRTRRALHNEIAQNHILPCPACVPALSLRRHSVQ
jgi:hypothetical protein